MKLNEHYRLLLEAGNSITVYIIRNAYLGISERGKKICEVFEYHNKQVEQLVGSDYSYGTLERYRTALKHIQDFIQWKYNLTDIDVKKVDYSGILIAMSMITIKILPRNTNNFCSGCEKSFCK